MLQLCLSLFIILVTYLLYSTWLQPSRLHQNYIKLFKEKGFKVKQIPFHPFKNNMIQAINKGLQEGDAMKVFKSYGLENYDVVVTNFLNRPRIQLINPELVKEFFAVDKHYSYPKQEKIVQIFERLGGRGLPFSEGHIWKRKRSILNKVFNFDFIKSQSERIAEICQRAVVQIEEEVQIKQKNEAKEIQFNILDLTVRMFSQVILEIFLGGTKEEKIDGVQAGQFIKKLVADLSQQSIKPLNFLLGSKFMSLGLIGRHRDINRRLSMYKKWGRQFVTRKINIVELKIKESPSSQPTDIIEALVIQKLKTEKGQQQFMDSSQQIFEQFTSFFVAGTDTTSNFTQMMIYLIAQNADIDKKVRQEIKTYMGKEKNFTFENMKNFKYIQCIQKEVTRFYGPGTHIFSRYALCDNYLGGIKIRKGTSIEVSHVPNHFCEKYFTEPKIFKPERWDQTDTKNLPAFVAGGFGGGARTCIGKHLAMLQSKIALIVFMQRYGKVSLGKEDYKMGFQFLYGPQEFNSKLSISQ